VVEDMNITGGQNDVPITPHAYFASTAVALLNRRPGDHQDPSTLSQIDRVDFAAGIAFVRKKDLKASEDRLVQRATDLVCRTNSPNNYIWLAEQLAEHDRYLLQAERAARRSVELHPGAEIYQIGLSKVLARRKDFVGATDAARRAIVIRPDQFECHFQLAAVFLEAGDVTQSDVAFEKCIEVAPAYLRVHIMDRRKKMLGGS
jgi:Flp pilus assembly protein TadD